MTSLLILGAGGHAKVLAETAISLGRFSRIAFLDDHADHEIDHQTVLGWPVLGPLKRIIEPQKIMKKSY